MAPVVGAVLPVAKTALDAGQLETAKRLYRRLLDVNPQSFQARMGLGEVAHQRRDGAEAMRWFLAALAHAKTVTQRHDALLHHGRAALDAGQLEHAQGSFARLTDPQEAATNEYVAYGLNGVGLTLLLSGDLRTAVTLMEQAVERLPGDQNLRRNLSRALELLAEQVATSNASDLGGGAAGQAQTTPGPGAPPKRELQAAADRIERAVARFEEAAERLTDAPTRNPAAPPSPSPSPSSSQDAPPPAPPAQAPPPPPAQAPPPPATEADVTPFAPAAGELTGFLVHETDGPFVQMAAYATAAKANALADRLRRVTEHPVRVAEKRGLHRVRIGPVPTQEALRALVGVLRDAGYGGVRMAARQDGDSVDGAETPANRGTRQTPAAPLQAFVVTAGGETFLQVGAFGARAKAAARADELRGLVATPIRVVEGVLPSGKLVHRVRFGPFRSNAELDGVVDALAAAGHPVAMPTAPNFNTVKPPAATRGEPSSAQPLDRPPPQRPIGPPPPTLLGVAGVDAPRVGAPEVDAPKTGAPKIDAPKNEPPPTIAPEDRPNGALRLENGAAAAVAEVVQAALAAAEVAAESQPGNVGSPPVVPGAEQPGEPPASSPPALAGARAYVITQDEGVFIQIGDYDARAEADDLAARMRVLTAEPVQVVEERDATAPFYRVRAGPVEDDADYEALLTAVADLGFEVQ